VLGNSKLDVIEPSENQYFRSRLLRWHRNINQRTFPWKNTRVPYKIWLSEIILQQTQVKQGLPYYQRFINRFPKIQDLASAEDDEVFKLWEGLGYYNRCRNMLHTARFISEELNGKFPNKYHDILALKGVGPYSAAAISSFAFDLPHAVVDGNVIRLLSRFFGISFLPQSAQEKKDYQALADRLLSKKYAAEYNQAIMDFGATVCRPKLPNCSKCPLRNKCYACQNEKVNEFPPKKKPLKLKTRVFHYFIPKNGKYLLIRKRSKKDIWQGLYELPLVETTTEKLIADSKKIGQKKQRLSHQIIHLNFYEMSPRQIGAQFELKHYNKIDRKNWSQWAYPRSIQSFLEEYFLSKDPKK